MRKLIVITGPTGSGKSEIAVDLALDFGGEIISVDSMQIYRGMDIGTAKVPVMPVDDTELMEYHTVLHHMIDIKNPDEEYSVALYKKEALGVIEDVYRREKLPFLVGGTGLYIEAITENLDIPEVPPNEALRAKREKDLKKHGVKFLYEKLLEMDPDAEGVIDGNNPRRVVRAMEIIEATGRPWSDTRKKKEKLFDVLYIAPKVDREELYTKINDRVDDQIRRGLVEEVRELGEQYGYDIPAMQGIGYKQIGMYVQGQMSEEEAVDLLKRDTRRFAKRQFTWMKRIPDLHWVESPREANDLIKAFLDEKK